MIFLLSLLNLAGCSHLLHSLGEVRAHVTLEIKVGKLVVLGKLKKLAELGIGKDAAPVLRVLKLVCTNVRVDLTGHLSARHLSTMLLAKECSKLLANLGRLHKTAGGTRSRLGRTFLVKLRGSAKLAVSALLKSTDLTRNIRQLTTQTSQLPENLNERITESRLVLRNSL